LLSSNIRNRQKEVASIHSKCHFDYGQEGKRTQEGSSVLEQALCGRPGVFTKRKPFKAGLGILGTGSQRLLPHTPTFSLNLGDSCGFYLRNTSAFCLGAQALTGNPARLLCPSRRLLRNCCHCLELPQEPSLLPPTPCSPATASSPHYHAAISGSRSSRSLGLYRFLFTRYGCLRLLWLRDSRGTRLRCPPYPTHTWDPPSLSHEG